MIITKETPLQPQEIELINQAGDNLDVVASKLRLVNRVGLPQQIVQAYQTLDNHHDLSWWLHNPKNLALHTLAIRAKRSSFIKLQSSSWGSQYSAVVNFYLLAQPKYRKPEWVPHLQPLFHHELFTAITSYDPQVLETLDLEHLQRLRQAVLEFHKKPADKINRPRIQNPYNLQNLNWIAILELWVCAPLLQHPNQLREFLTQPVQLIQQELFL